MCVCVRLCRYHAGLSDKERTDILKRWLSRDLDLVAATVAFGMGIDRPGGYGAHTHTHTRTHARTHAHAHTQER